MPSLLFVVIGSILLITPVSGAHSSSRSSLPHLIFFAAANLTTWGFQDCAPDPDNGAYGAAVPKLLLRHLPRHYPANSVYSLFPFFTPETSKKILKSLGVLEKYETTRPKKVIPVPKSVNTLKGIDYVFSQPEKFKVTYTPDMNPLTNGFGFMLVFDERAKYALSPDQWIKGLTILQA